MHQRLILLAGVALLALPTCVAIAHPGHVGDFHTGWHHPLTGPDHLLAMLAVVLLAMRCQGHGRWLVPLLFLGGMFVGGGIAALGRTLPGGEWVLTVWAAVLALMLVVTPLAPVWLSTGFLTLFGLFDGHAHAAELAANGSLAGYGSGILASTALLLAVGMAAAWILGQLRRPHVTPSLPPLAPPRGERGRG